ncbi:MAG: hypothetical protein JO053_15100 [Acidobacteria bacterium]|nr:hypothetical protein [Acidobacteriota bacterium]
MIAWLEQFWASLTWTSVILGGIGVVVTFVVSYVVVTIILVKMPANYFHSDYEHHFFPDSHPVARAVAIGVKNVLGILVIVTGIILSLPGVPGPGLLTIFIGVMMTDIPGKRRLESKIVERPAVLSAINRLRAKYNKPALLLDEK